MLMALAAGLPAVILSLILLFSGDFTARVQWTFGIIIICCWLGFATALRERVVRPLQSTSNLLAAMREGDYSVRARDAGHSDVLGELLIEVNTLSETLHRQRLGEIEATALLRTVMSEIDVAVFAFDVNERLRMVNRAGEALLAQTAERLLGRRADEVGLHRFLAANGLDQRNKTLEASFPGGAGRWAVVRGTFRQHGTPHHLLVLTDLSRALREEELKAWQRIVRVLAHELNNSLAPIKSIAGSLASLISRTPRPDDWETDAQRGLVVISKRAEALSRFMASYAQLARLPPPRKSPVEIGSLLRRAVSLEPRLQVEIVVGAEVRVEVDADQIEQLLINIIRNGVDAALETNGKVSVGWHVKGSHLEIWVQDEGPGLADTANLFVPFFTTKQGGTGVGLILSRQIAEAHGGNLTLENRRDTQGVRACLNLPL